MYGVSSFLKCVVAAFLAVGVLLPQASAQTPELDDLFAQLQQADPADRERIESRIWNEWSKSGSAAMDLLLNRGREAMEADDIEAAIDHFSALIDHAPEFAEGYNARAMAFYQTGRYGQALDDIGHTLALNPRHFGALSGLALILQDLGMDEDALAAWRAVIDLNPGREDARDAIEMLERQIEGTAL